MERKYGTRSTSDLAAYSLQAGMTVPELQRFARTVGAPINREELTQIRTIRRSLAGQVYREGFKL
jgi:hypothetical protein